MLVVSEPLALPREELLRQVCNLMLELGDASAQLRCFIELVACSHACSSTHGEGETAALNSRSSRIPSAALRVVQIESAEQSSEIGCGELDLLRIAIRWSRMKNRR